MRVAVLPGALAPCRVPLYNELARLAGKLAVFLSGENIAGRSRLPYGIEFSVKATQSLSIGTTRTRYGIRGLCPYTTHIPVGALLDLTRFRPDAVVTMTMGASTALVLPFCLLTRTPLVVHWGGSPHTENPVGRLKRLVRSAFFSKAVGAWASYGSSSTAYLRSLGIPKGRIFEAHNCVDHDFFARPVPPALDLSPKPALLYVGRFIPLKGLERFFRAASILQESGRRFSILLVGSGPQETELRGLASSLGLRNVVFHPFAQLNELPGLYRSAEVLVFPTLQDVWGLVVNEALASGIPVLCSKYAGCAPDLVPESWQFDPFDVEGNFVPALEKAMRRGWDGRKDFLPVSEMRGPRDAARAIMAAIEKAKARDEIRQRGHSLLNCLRWARSGPAGTGSVGREKTPGDASESTQESADV